MVQKYYAYYVAPGTKVFEVCYYANIFPYDIDLSNPNTTIMAGQMEKDIYVTSNHDNPTTFIQIHNAHDITSHKDIGRADLIYWVNQFEGKTGQYERQ